MTTCWLLLLSLFGPLPHVMATFFLNSCGCGGGPPPPPRCPPPAPPCQPRPAQAACAPCDCAAFGSAPSNLISSSYRGPGYVQAPFAPLPPALPPPVSNTYLQVPQGNYVESFTIGPRYSTTPHSHHRPHTHDNGERHGHSSHGIDDVYDEVIPTSNSLADVSLDSKKFAPSDVFVRRNRFLKQLRNRALRQFSANSLHHNQILPQLDERSYQPSVCNNQKLAKIMVKSMVDDITASKRLVRKATELAFDGQKFDVLCANGDFSYSVYAKQYCEATRGNVTCFAFL